MSEKYKSTYRCYLIDHHSPQPPIVPLGKMEIGEYEAFLLKSHVDSQMVYFKDHWGVSYYPTKTPGAKMHQGVNKEWMKNYRKVIHKNNIEFVAYYCIEYDEGAARDFPEWRVLRADGTPLFRDDIYAKWSLCCYQTGYRQYCLSQINEILRNYYPDALFLDIFGSSLCYCKSCRSKFKSIYGYELPEDKEGIEQNTRDIVSFLDNNAAEFLDEIKHLAAEIDPSIAVTINFSCHYPKVVRDKLDYQFSEPLLKDNWFSAAYARDTAIGQYPILAPGEASQVYNYDHINRYISDLSCIAAQGCRVGMYSGSQHIDGSLDFEEANRLGAAYRELEKMHPHLVGREPLKCIGIIQSDNSSSVNLEELNPDAILRAKKHNPHLNALLGAMQLCENSKIPWNILPDLSLTAEQLADYSMIILPEVYVISDELESLLHNYVENGGNLILSAGCGTKNIEGFDLSSFSSSKLIGANLKKIHHEYRNNHWSAYLNNISEGIFDGLLSCTTPPVSEFFTEVEPTTSVALLTFILPCTAVSPTQWVNWWSPPPGEHTDMPALLYNRIGKGNVIYCAFDLFTMMQTEKYNYLDSLFDSLLKICSVSPPIKNLTDIPLIIRTGFFRREDEFLVHQISMLSNKFKGQTHAVSGGKLRLDKGIKPKKAYLVYPEKEPLHIESSGDFAEISLPDFSIQQIISIQC